MKYEEWILIDEICVHYQVEQSFLEALNENEMIHLKRVAQKTYLSMEEIGHFEKMRRLHYEMNINLEGLEVIQLLLDKMSRLKNENRQLRNRLRIFE